MQGDYYTPYEHGATHYERVIPARFTNDGDDLFMRSMLNTYALEEKSCDKKKENCAPSGKFWMSESSAKDATEEVL